jgi:hypothetical protein
MNEPVGFQQNGGVRVPSAGVQENGETMVSFGFSTEPDETYFPRSFAACDARRPGQRRAGLSRLSSIEGRPTPPHFLPDGRSCVQRKRCPASFRSRSEGEPGSTIA